MNYVNYMNCEMQRSLSYLQMLLLVMVSFVLFPPFTHAFGARKKYNATHKISARKHIFNDKIRCINPK